MYFNFLILLLFASCAQTVVNKNSKRAVYNKSNNDIVWNQKVFEMKSFSLTYRVDEMFLDDIETQNEIKKANNEYSTSIAFLWSGFGLAVLYLATTDDKPRSYRKNKYYGTFIGIGLIPYLYYTYKASNRIEKSINNYNKKKEYVLNPIYFKDDFDEQYGLALNFRY